MEMILKQKFFKYKDARNRVRGWEGLRDTDLRGSRGTTHLCVLSLFAFL